MPIATSRFVRSITAALLAFAGTSALGAQEPMTLQQAIAMAQQQGLQARVVARTLEAARKRDHSFGARRLPQVWVGGTLPNYSKSIQSVQQPDGTFRLLPSQNTSNVLNASIQQRLPFSGGDFSISSSVQRFDVVRPGATTTSSTRTWSSTPISFQLNQPIYRPNNYKWDAREEDINVERAERAYLESREDIAVQTATAFMNYYSAQASLKNAGTNAMVNDTLYRISSVRFGLGALSEIELQRSQLGQLQAAGQLETAKQQYDQALMVLQRAINVPAGTPIHIQPPVDIPAFDVDTTMAVAQALRNRPVASDLDLAAVRAERRVNDARLANTFGGNLSATYGYNQSAAQLGESYKDLLSSQRLTLSMSMPIMLWGQHSADVQAARADQQSAEATARLTRAQTAQDVHFAAMAVGQNRRTLALAAKSDTLAAKVFAGDYQRYVLGQNSLSVLYQSQQTKDLAVQQYNQALSSFWISYYQLRRQTLYDFETKRVIE